MDADQKKFSFYSPFPTKKSEEIVHDLMKELGKDSLIQSLKKNVIDKKF